MINNDKKSKRDSAKFAVSQSAKAASAPNHFRVLIIFDL